MFGRRKGTRRAESEPTDAGAMDLGAAAVVEEAPASVPAGPGPTTGPWDVTDVPNADDPPRVDLGSLRVPVQSGLELRVDVNDQGQVVAATLVSGPSAMQVNAFAAPRSEGIWADVAAEIAESLRSSGGAAETVAGPFGSELKARVPSGAPGAPAGSQPARFVGVDGPRWFLRGLLTGPAATDPGAARPLEAAFRDIVVTRGNEAMAVRDPLPLRLPTDVVNPAEAAAAEGAGDGPEPETQLPGLPERGPEITEVR